MRIIGCDLHARQQTLAMLDTTSGEVVNKTLQHEGNQVRAFYSGLPRPVRVGIEATGSMQWFVNLLEDALKGSARALAIMAGVLFFFLALFASLWLPGDLI